MKFKGTAIFAIIVAAIVGFSIVEFNKIDDEKKAEAVAGNLFKDLDTQTVNKISLNTDQTNYLFELKDGKWTVITPFQDLTDNDIMDSFLKAVSSQSTEEVPVDGEINWAKFGLDKPSYDLKIATNDGKENRVQVGSVRTFNEGFYLRVNNGNQLIVASKSFEAQIKKTPLDFHSKHLRLPKGAWAEVEFKSNDKTLPANERQWKFVHTEKGWEHDKNKKWLLNQSQFNELERMLVDLKANEVTSESKTEAALKVSHLSQPDKILTIKTADKKIDVVFSAEKDTSVFYTSTDNLTLFKATAGQVKSIFKKASDFRNKKFPFEFDDKSIQQVRIKDDTKKTDQLFKRDTMGWTKSGLAVGETVNVTAVNDIITSLKALQINDFPTQKPSKSFANVIELQNAESQTVFKIEFGLSYKVSDVEQFYAKTNNSDEYFGINKASLQALLDKKFIDVVIDKKEK
jgi:hypothetical protein